MVGWWVGRPPKMDGIAKNGRRGWQARLAGRSLHQHELRKRKKRKTFSSCCSHPRGPPSQEPDWLTLSKAGSLHPPGRWRVIPRPRESPHTPWNRGPPRGSLPFICLLLLSWPRPCFLPVHSLLMVPPARRHARDRDILPTSISWGAAPAAAHGGGGGNGNSHGGGAKKRRGGGRVPGSAASPASQHTAILGYDFRTSFLAGVEGFVPTGTRQWLKYDAQGKMTVIPVSVDREREREREGAGWGKRRTRGAPWEWREGEGRAPSHTHTHTSLTHTPLSHTPPQGRQAPPDRGAPPPLPGRGHGQPPRPDALPAHHLHPGRLARTEPGLPARVRGRGQGEREGEGEGVGRNDRG